MIIITCCKHFEKSLGLICIMDFQVQPQYTTGKIINPILESCR